MSKEGNNRSRTAAAVAPHLQALIQALQGIAGSIGMDPAYVDVPQFFHDYMYGCWHPFEEASRSATEDLVARNQDVDQLITILKKQLPEGSHKQVELYIEAVNARYVAELDYAYMVGFQTAFRMLLLGLLAPEAVMESYRKAVQQ